MTFMYILVAASLLVALIITGIYVVAAIREANRWLPVRHYLRGVIIEFRVLEDEPRVRRALTLALDCLGEVYPLDVLQLNLSGVSVAVIPSETWTQPETNRTVSGEAYPSVRAVKVNQSLTSLVHELAHIIEAGPARFPVTEEHAGWAERGLFTAIDKYQRLLSLPA